MKNALFILTTNILALLTLSSMTVDAMQVKEPMSIPQHERALVELNLDEFAQEELIPSGYTEDDFDKMGNLVIKTELPAYETSTETITYTVTNRWKTKNAEYGDEYRIEYLIDNQWNKVPFAGIECWNLGLNIVRPGEAKAHTFSTSAFNFDWPEGEYRIIRKVANKLYKADFTIQDN